jgi:hypothetical protein
VLSTPNTSLTKVAWLRGNDGWIRSYRVRPSDATHAPHYYTSLRAHARSAFPTVPLFMSVLDSIEDVCCHHSINCRTAAFHREEYGRSKCKRLICMKRSCW